MTTPSEARITGAILLVIAALTLYAAWPVVRDLLVIVVTLNGG